jgi:hypothetical protein
MSSAAIVVLAAFFPFGPLWSKAASSTTAVPQSPSGTLVFCVGVTGWPRTVRPSIAELFEFPELPSGVAFASARTISRVAVISPPKRLRASTSLVPVASAVLRPASVDALAETAWVVATEPSAG